MTMTAVKLAKKLVKNLIVRFVQTTTKLVVGMMNHVKSFGIYFKQHKLCL